MFVGGVEWHGDPRAVRLTPHAQIVLEIRGYVPPHPFYLFPKERAMSRRLVLVAATVAVVAAGCGGSSKPSFPTVGAARTYKLTQFHAVEPGARRRPGDRVVRDPATRRHAV